MSDKPSRTRPARSAALAAVLLTAVLGAGGCSRAIGGTPVATPGQAGLAAKLNTTCRDYVEMTQAERRDVIAAIGDDGNTLVAENPDQWAAVASALCRFLDPSAPVKDVLPGGAK